jgi:hypothetical protein
LSVTLTYDTALSRIKIEATSLAAATTALIERSTDLITWTTVRGGVAATVVAGALTPAIYDYEFTAGVSNTYRVRGVSSAPVSFVAAGAAAVSQNTVGTSTLVPALPAGIATDDLFLILASIRNSGVGTVNTPAGWTQVAASGNVALLGRRAQAGDTAPTISFTGGVALASIIAQCIALRNAELAPFTSSAQLNGSAQNVAYPAVNLDQDGLAVLAAGWKQDDWASVATLAGMTEIAEPVETGGDDAGQVWDYVIQTTAANVGAGSFVVTGGAAAISRGLVVAFEHAAFLNEQTATVTPAMDRIWLKSVNRSFLNRVVTVVGWSTVERGARSSVHDVVGRSYPVAINDVRGSKEFTLEVYTTTHEDAQTLDYVLASGDVLFVHTPAGCEVPGGYVRVGDTAENRPRPRTVRRVFALPCTEVVRPGPDIVAAEGTWTSVLAAYGSWSAVLAAFPTWADLLALRGAPAEVVVP